MILELDTKLLEKLPESITLSQFIFISVLLYYMDNNNTSAASFPFSMLDWKEINELIPEWADLTIRDDGAKIYKHSKKLEDLVSEAKTMFDDFMDEYPAVVRRTDGTNAYLKTNINKCRIQYNKIIGKSKSKHEHILMCLKSEITQRMLTGKMSYMKTMWKWLVNSEWETYEEQLKDEQPIESQLENGYGTTII